MRRATHRYDLLPGLVEPSAVEWDRVRRARYLIQQRLRYEYPGPIEDLRHRLLVLPWATFGAQTRVSHHFAMSADGDVIAREDDFGNPVLELHVPYIESAIDFTAHVAVDRCAGPEAAAVPEHLLRDPRLLTPSRLTQPGAELEEFADTISASGLAGADLAEAVSHRVFSAMRYEHGVTTTFTTAAEAFALRQGVCQDFAHVMIAACRLLGLPTRYVSGHMLGEGGTHAWVEVLVGDETGARAWALDPTHDRRAGITYVSVAVGRDYADVAPTSGTYRAAHQGRLSTSKRVDITELEYAS